MQPQCAGYLSLTRLGKSSVSFSIARTRTADPLLPHDGADCFGRLLITELPIYLWIEMSCVSRVSICRLRSGESIPECATVSTSGDGQSQHNQDRRNGERNLHAICNGIGGRCSNVARR